MGSLVQAPWGPHFRTTECTAINRTGSTLTKGAVVQLDTTLSSEATGYVLGPASATSEEFDGFMNVTLPVSQNFGVHAVLLDDQCGDDEEGQFLLEGIVQAKVLSDSGGTPSTAVAASQALQVDVSQDHLVAGTGSQGLGANDGKVVAFLIEPAADETVEELVRVLFSGISGFGTP